MFDIVNDSCQISWFVKLKKLTEPLTRTVLETTNSESCFILDQKESIDLTGRSDLMGVNTFNTYNSFLKQQREAFSKNISPTTFLKHWKWKKVGLLYNAR